MAVLIAGMVMILIFQDAKCIISRKSQTVLVEYYASLSDKLNQTVEGRYSDLLRRRK